MFNGLGPVDVRCTGSVTFRLQDLSLIHPLPQGSIHPHNIGKVLRSGLERNFSKTIDGDGVPSFLPQKLIWKAKHAGLNIRRYM